MKIGDYLKSIGQVVISCHRDDSAQDAAIRLSENGIGAMPVLGSAGELVGMISERDLVRDFAKQGAGLENLKVGDILTKSVVFMGAELEFSAAMENMNKYGFRHIPIMSGGKVIGVISIRDVLAHAVSHDGDIGQHPILAVAPGGNA